MPDTGTTNWPADTDDLNLPADMTIAPTGAGDGNYTFSQWLERVTGMLRATAHDLLTAMTHDLPMGGHKITGLADGTAAGDAATWNQFQLAINNASSSSLGVDVDPGGASAAAFTTFFTHAFTAPPSGAVVVAVDVGISPQTADTFLQFVVNGTAYTMGRHAPTDYAANGTVRVADLVPGNVYNVDVKYKVAAGGIFHCRASSLPDYEHCRVTVRAAA